jgi:hypothetical protein
MSLKPKAIEFLSKALGRDGFEELNKTVELFKKKTNTVLDPEEMKIALQIVPRTILSFLQKELGSMKEDEGKKIKIPVETEAYLQVTKFANDVYSGEVIQSGKVVSSFRYRSLPGVGLVLVSAFELYDISDLSHMGKQDFGAEEKVIQDLIDEKLRVRDLVSKVVDQKLSEREAIDQMIRLRLSQMLVESENKKEEIQVSDKPVKKPLKLKEFLEKKEAKKKAAVYEIKIEKSENVTCPDCKKKIFDNSGFSGCVCFGPDRNKKIHIRKSEGGISLSFSKTWDAENIEMLLEVLRERNNRGRK